MIKQALTILTGLFMTLSANSVWADKLADIHQRITEKYVDVKHIDAKTFSDQLASLDNQNIVVFDVREINEFEVSHLDNAIQIDPGIKSEEFFEQFGDQLSGKTAVFYCSVGRRSSRLINRLETDGNDLEMVNLEGGIFRWTNETRPVDGVGVHPYNWYWSRLINDKELIHYSPLMP